MPPNFLSPTREGNFKTISPNFLPLTKQNSQTSFHQQNKKTTHPKFFTLTKQFTKTSFD